MALKKRTAPPLFATAAFALLGVPGIAAAQTSLSRSPVITAPAAGARVASPLTVSFTLPAPDNALAGAGAMPGGKHRHGGQVYLLIDTPPPAAGDAITAGPADIAFPAGQQQVSVVLPAGLHHLQIVFATHRGTVSARIQPSAPVAVTVQ